MKTYLFDFSTDDGNWIFNNANISGGYLNIIASWGNAKRSPDANWLSEANDDFEIEMDFKADSLDNDFKFERVYLIDDVNAIFFSIYGNEILIRYDGIVKASQAWTPDIEWHTEKIRRVGTIYYYSIDGGAEISWNYGTARAINYLQYWASIPTIKYDNFKYSWMKEAKKNFILFYGSKGRGKE